MTTNEVRSDKERAGFAKLLAVLLVLLFSFLGWRFFAQNNAARQPGPSQSGAAPAAERQVDDRPATLSILTPSDGQVRILPELYIDGRGVLGEPEPLELPLHDLELAPRRYLLMFLRPHPVNSVFLPSYSHLVELKPGEVREVSIEPQFDLAGTHIPDVSGKLIAHPVNRPVKGLPIHTMGAAPVPVARARVDTAPGEIFRIWGSGRRTYSLNKNETSLHAGMYWCHFMGMEDSNDWADSGWSWRMGFVAGEQQYRLAKGMRVSPDPDLEYYAITNMPDSVEAKIDIEVWDRNGQPMRAMVRHPRTVGSFIDPPYTLTIRPAGVVEPPAIRRWALELTGPDGKCPGKNLPYDDLKSVSYGFRRKSPTPRVNKQRLDVPQVWPDRPALSLDAGDDELADRWRLALDWVTTNGVDQVLVFEEKPATWLRGSVAGGQVTRLQTAYLAEMDFVRWEARGDMKFGVVQEIENHVATFLSQGLPAHLPTLDVYLAFDLPGGGWIEGIKTISLSAEEQGAVARRTFAVDDPAIRWFAQAVPLVLREADGGIVGDPKIQVWHPRSAASAPSAHEGRFFRCGSRRDLAVIHVPPTADRERSFRVRVGAHGDIGGTETAFRFFDPRLELELPPRCSVVGQVEGEIELTDVPLVKVRDQSRGFTVGCDLDRRFAFPRMHARTYTFQVCRGGKVVLEQEVEVSKPRQNLRFKL